MFPRLMPPAALKVTGIVRVASHPVPALPSLLLKRPGNLGLLKLLHCHLHSRASLPLGSPYVNVQSKGLSLLST
jgi:hypothetical protein